MSRVKYLSLALAVVAVAGLLASSGAFSSITADRGIQVSVVDDEQAYLGLDKDESVSGSEDENVTLFTVTNQFSEPISVSVTWNESGDLTLEDREIESSLDPDHSRTVETSCTSNETVKFTLEAETNSGSTLVTTDSRTVIVECNPDQ